MAANRPVKPQPSDGATGGAVQAPPPPAIPGSAVNIDHSVPARPRAIVPRSPYTSWTAVPSPAADQATCRLVVAPEAWVASTKAVSSTSMA